MQIDPRIVMAAAAEMGASPTPHVRVPMNYSLLIFEALSRLQQSLVGEATPLEQQTRFAQCVRLIITESCERSSSPRFPADHAGVGRARDYLHAHFGEPVRLDELAVIAGVGRFHLARAFGRAFGLPPHAYQNQLRIAAARTQIQHGTPPSRIDVGFADQAHLTRHFKRTFGITPGQYARVTSGT
jgi:AraC family transcriptional regulator